MRRDDKFITDGVGTGGVGTSTNHFYPHKVDFGRDRHDGGVWIYRHHCIAPPVVS